MNPHTGFPRLWWRLAQAERTACIRRLREVGEPGAVWRGPLTRWQRADAPMPRWSSTYALQPPYQWISPHLAPVHRPPASFYESVAAWYRYQHRHAEELLHILGDRSCPRHRFMVRWQWPPVPGSPVHGWRAQLVARCFVATCMAHKWRMDWHTWDALQHVAKGQAPFSASLLARVNAGVVSGKLYWERRHKPFVISLAGGLTLGRR